jgi:flagellar assembly protein FliH
MKSSSNIIRANSDKAELQDWSPVEFEQDNLFTEEMIHASAISFFGLKPGLPKEKKQNLFKSNQGELNIQQWNLSEMNQVSTNTDEVLTQTWAPFLEKPNPRKIADEIITEAHNKADEIINSAQTTADQIRQQALNQGMENAKAEMKETLQATASIINVAREWRSDMMNQAEPMIMDLVKKIAQKMFGEGIVLDNVTLQQHFSSVVESARALDDLRIYMNPADAMVLGPDWREYQASILGHKVEILSNESIKRGGCYIQGEWGTADSLVETQLTSILNQFSEVEKPEKEDE